MTTTARDFAMIAAGTMYFILAYYLTMSQLNGINELMMNLV